MESFQIIAEKIYVLIKLSSTIILHRHINPDGDALGSQWGLKLLIESNFPDKKVLVPGDMNDNMARMFAKPDKVKAKDYEGALVIVTDTANKERISGEFWDKGATIVKIDHHPEVDNYAKESLVDKDAIAACQVVIKMAKILNWKISATAARHLFLGLVTDSGRFLYNKVNAETFELASDLVATGFSLLDMYEVLYQQDTKTARIKGYIFNNFTISENGVAHLIMTKEDLKKLEDQINKDQKVLHLATKITISDEEVTNHVNMLGNTSGVKIWMLACENPNGSEYRVSVRSARWVINDIVASFGGGGHQNAAGVKIKEVGIVNDLLKKLDFYAITEPNIK